MFTVRSEGRKGELLEAHGAARPLVGKVWSILNLPHGSMMDFRRNRCAQTVNMCTHMWVVF